MTKILVKKSAPKGVLVRKNVGQQLPNDQGLFQTPDRGKGLFDFARTAFGPRRTESKIGVKPTSRLAALAGLAGKGIAGVGAVNETMNAMQGGNMSAPLGIGYAYERLDPTGRMISDMADPTLSYKPPKLDRTPPKKASVDAFLDPRNSHTRGPVGPPVRLPPTISNPKGELISQNDPRMTQTITGNPVKTDYSKTPYAQMLAAGKGMSQQRANSILTQNQSPFQPFVADRPSPVEVPNEAVANVTNVSGPTISTATPPGGVMTNPSPPMLAQQQTSTPPVKTLEQHNAALMGQQAQPVQPTAAQPVQPTAAQPVQPTAAPQPVTQSSSTHSSVPQNLLEQQQKMGQYMQQNNLMSDPDDVNRSFVTALTEKLGADVVYKMTPHQMGSFAAYTLLKLR